MCKYIQGFALPPKAVTYSKLLFFKNYSSTRLQNEKTFAKKTQNIKFFPLHQFVMSLMTIQDQCWFRPLCNSTAVYEPPNDFLSKTAT